MKKPVVHFEIGCNNIPETVEFYKEVFNWNIVPKGNSASIDVGKDGGISGHINKLGPGEPQNYINIYIETTELEDDLNLIESKGGKKLVGPISLPDRRKFAWFQDVAGNTVGLITPH
jgi:uncharacterized protein